MSPMASKLVYAISPYTTTGTLASTGGGTPSGGGVTPILETENHFAYIIGDNDGNFNATANMTRAEAATIFYRLLKDQSYETDTEFTDVSESNWYYDAVMALAAKGIITGYDDGQFKPGNTITRAEFCAMASRFFELSTSTTFDFDDVSEDFWAYKYIMSAADKGWVNGYENDDGTYSFMPGNSIKRAEVVKIVNAMLERAADESYVDNHADALTNFADLPTSYWAYYQIMEAANGHVYTKDSKGNETWTKLK